jgi:hypothetical protein
MREMHWTWADYLAAPASLVRHLSELMKQRAEEQQQEAAKTARKTGRTH